MENDGVKDEMRAYLELLQKGELTEIDLDALGSCLTEAVRVMDENESNAASGRMLRGDLISEIVRLGRAASALTDGVTLFDSGKLTEKLSACDTETLLNIRKKTRAGFTSLLRSDDMPRKTVAPGIAGISLADFKLENERV
jgi:hypothetical protein